MDKDKAVNTTQPAAVAPEVEKVTISTEDYESKVKALEDEKNRIVEESANWKLAYFKEKGKNGNLEETDEEKMRRIAREEASNAKVQTIDTEKAALLSKALKENKELKLALSGRNPIPSGLGSHNETTQATDTLVTTEQLAAFKARGWTDKDIERYKRNLRKNAR